MPVVPATAYSQSEDALNLAHALVNGSGAPTMTDASAIESEPRERTR